MVAEKDFRERLTNINNSVFGKGKICESADASEICTETRNSRSLLATTTKDLYKLCEEVLNAIDELNVSNKLTADNPAEGIGATDDIADKIASAVKHQIDEMLPSAIETAITQFNNKTKEIAHNSGITNNLHSEQQQHDRKHIENGPKGRTKHILLVEHKETEGNGDAKDITELEWNTVVKGKVSKNLKSVPVKKAAITKNGRASIHLPDEDSLNKATEALKGEFKVTQINKSEVNLLPKIKISDINKEYLVGADNTTMKEFLTGMIKEKNEKIKALIDNGNEFQVVYLDKASGNAVIKISPEIRKYLKDNNDKVHIGLEYYHIEDQYHIIQCFHCQGYGHMSNSPKCPQKNNDPTCLYCAGSHKSGVCGLKRQKEQHQCINCLDSKNSQINSRAKTHTATDKLCPFVILETKRVMGRTLGAEHSKNLYIQKIKNQQRQR